MEWSNENILEFLDCYGEEPIIWQESHSSHKNRDEVFNAWKRIETKLGKKYTVSDLKKKKDSLMASFRSCHNKVRQSRSSGTDEIYKPNWFAYEKILSFRKDKDQSSTTIKSEEISLEEEIINYGIETKVLVDDIPEKAEPIKKEVANSAIVLPSTSNSVSTVPCRKRKNISDPDDLTHKLNDAYSILKTTIRKSVKENDICDKYGELIAAKLRNMDEHTREIAMHRMDNILFEMKMNRIMPSSNQHLDTDPLNVTHTQYTYDETSNGFSQDNSANYL